MKALSLWQPWATLIATGAKRIETRSWYTPYRGPLAIHAAKKRSRELDQLCVNSPPFERALKASGNLVEEGDRLALTLPIGAIVATARLVACLEMGPGTVAYRQTSDGTWVEGHPVILCAPPVPGAERDVLLPPAEPERSFGLYAPGRFAWVLADVRALREPIAYKGGQQLFNVPDHLIPGAADAQP